MEMPEKLSENLINENAQAIKHIGSIGVGKNTTIKRLTLAGDHPSLRIAAATKEQLGYFSRTFLFTPIAGTDTFINIRSTAKRLGITHKEVENLAKQGKVALQGAFEKRQGVLSQYKGIIKKNYTDEGKLKKEGAKLTPELLLKTIQLGFKELDEVPKKEDVFFSDDLKQMHVFTKEPLGKGEFGVVYKTFELISNSSKAVKQLDLTEEQKNDSNLNVRMHNLRYNDQRNEEEEIEKKLTTRKESAKNEKTILDELDHPNIQSSPSEIVVITNTKGDTRTIYQTELLAGNLNPNSSNMEKFYILSKKQQLQLLKGPVDGVAYMHKKGFIHRDLKPDNLLMETNAQRVPTKIMIADFGLAEKDPNEKNMEKEGEVGSFRPEEEDNTKEKVDVFALSVSLIDILLQGESQFDAPNRSIQLQTKDEGKGSTNHDLLIAKGTPQAMADLLLEGIGPQENRPTSEQFQQRYNQILNRM